MAEPVKQSNVIELAQRMRSNKSGSDGGDPRDILSVQRAQLKVLESIDKSLSNLKIVQVNTEKTATSVKNVEKNTAKAQDKDSLERNSSLFKLFGAATAKMARAGAARTGAVAKTLGVAGTDIIGKTLVGKSNLDAGEAAGAKIRAGLAAPGKMLSKAKGGLADYLGLKEATTDSAEASAQGSGNPVVDALNEQTAILTDIKDALFDQFGYQKQKDLENADAALVAGRDKNLAANDNQAKVEKKDKGLLAGMGLLFSKFLGAGSALGKGLLGVTGLGAAAAGIKSLLGGKAAAAAATGAKPAAGAKPTAGAKPAAGGAAKPASPAARPVSGAASPAARPVSGPAKPSAAPTTKPAGASSKPKFTNPLNKYPLLKKFAKVPGIGYVLGAMDLYQLLGSDASGKQKVAGVAGILGGLGGSTLGAMAGATVGSVVPGAGTLIGGLLGGAGGYFAGDMVAKGLAEWLLGEKVTAFPGFINDMINNKKDPTAEAGGGGEAAKGAKPTPEPTATPKTPGQNITKKEEVTSDDLKDLSISKVGEAPTQDDLRILMHKYGNEKGVDIYNKLHVAAGGRLKGAKPGEFGGGPLGGDVPAASQQVAGMKDQGGAASPVIAPTTNVDNSSPTTVNNSINRPTPSSRPSQMRGGTYGAPRPA